MRYFEFDMLNKHFDERLEYISSWIWLAFFLIVCYTVFKLFKEYDN
jgi:cytochrome oxidase assembly protein ShyY1